MTTDAQIYRDVVAAVSRNPILSIGRLTLEVNNGDVTLSGHVKSLNERKALERAVHRVTGIRTLALDLRAEVVGRLSAGEVATTLMRRLVVESTKI